jgi:hypothetical protein
MQLLRIKNNQRVFFFLVIFFLSASIATRSCAMHDGQRVQGAEALKLKEEEILERIDRFANRSERTDVFIKKSDLSQAAREFIYDIQKIAITLAAIAVCVCGYYGYRICKSYAKKTDNKA